MEDGLGRERETVALRREKGTILSSKRSKTTMKTSWVDKDLKIKYKKRHKKRCSEENGAV